MKQIIFNCRQISLCTLLLFIITSGAYAAGQKSNPLVCSGNVYDLYTVEEITGTLSEVLELSDSTVISSSKSYDIVNGVRHETPKFQFTVPSRDREYLIRFTKEGYNPEYMRFDPSKYSKRREYVRLDNIYLERKSKTLADVNVVASKVQFYHRGDTLVYNADAFILPEGSMLDALLEQLPGVKLDNNGVITVNGKKVDYLLLDGKEFFSRDKRLMLKNIASYTIKNVEVYETLSEQYGSGRPGDEKQIMDVKLKKEYATGYAGNVEAGYGTSDRYLGRLFAGLFTKTFTLGLVGNANNLNDTRQPAQEGTWNPGEIKKGENRTEMGGLTYSLKGKDKSFTLYGEVLVNHSDFKNSSSQHVTSFLPQGNNYGFDFTRQRNKDLQISTGHSFYMERKWGFVRSEIGFDYNKSKEKTELKSAVFNRNVQNISSHTIDNLYVPSGSDLTDALVNRLLTSDRLRGHSSNGRFNTAGKYKFQSSGISLYGKIYADYSASHDDKLQDYELNFGNIPEPVENYERNFRNFPNHSYSIGGEASVTWNISTKLSISEGYDYNRKSITATSDIYLLSETSGEYDYVNPSMRNAQLNDNSFSSSEFDNVHKLETLIAYNPKKGTQLMIGVPVMFNFRHLDYTRPGDHYVLSKRLIYPEVNVWLNSMDEKFNSFIFMYDMRSSLPGMVNYLDIDDTTDPLNIRTGNASLDRTVSHIFRIIDFRRFGKFQNNIEMSFQTITNALANGFTYDPSTGVRTFKPMNISGDNEWRMKYRIETPFGKKSRFRISNTLEYKRRTNHDYVSENEDGTAFTSMVRSRVRNLSFTDKLSLSYSFSGNKITAFGTGVWNRYTGSLASFRSFNAWDVNYGVSGIFKLPYNFGLTTDFTVYMRRGYNDSALNTDNYVWNARLSWSTLKGNLVLMLDGWDILHDIKNVSYHVNTQGRTETFSTVLPRYLMFHVQYRFNKQPKSKK